MNGYNTNDYIGGLGEYYLINYITNVSNILESHIKTNISSNALIHTDINSNTIIYSSNEIQFSNTSNFNTKIDNSGILRIYHPQTITLPTVSSQWISVPDAIVYLLQEDIQWNTQSADTTAHLALLDTEIIGINTRLTTDEAYINTNTAATATNSTLITAINATLPTLVSSNALGNILNTCNYLPKSGGTMTGTLIAPNITNSTSFIYQGTELTTTLTNYMLKAGATMTGRLNFNYALFGDPSPSGVGDRVVLNLGIGTTGYASSIGINTNSYWFSAPTSTNYNWYVNGGNIMSLSSTGTLNTTILQEGGTSLSSKYLTITNASSTYQSNLTVSAPLTKTGNNITIDLSLYDTITARNTAITTALTSYSTTGNDPNYLKLSGGALTGNLSTNSQITGFTTLNGTTGIFGTLSTTNNTNQSIPAVGNFGGTGDKIIIYNGTSTTYPYSIGYETNSLWISSPSNIKFYNTGINTILINSNFVNISNQIKLSTGIWHNSLQDNIQRFYFASNDVTYFSCGKLPAGIGGFQYNNSLGQAIMSLTDAGNINLPYGSLYVAGNMTASGRTIFSSNVGIGNTNPQGTLHIGNVGSGAVNSGSLVLSKNNGSGGVRNFQMGYDANFNFVFGDFGGNASGNSVTPQMSIAYGAGSNSLTINSSGNVGIGTNNASTTLDVRGAITLANNIWHNSTEGINRIYFNNNGTTFFHSGNVNGNGFRFRSTAQSDIVIIDDGGSITTSGNITASGNITGNQFLCSASSTNFNGVFVNSAGVTSPGYFIFLNNWWYSGYAYLTISASITQASNQTYVWMGRVFLSANSSQQGATTIQTNGGVISIVNDYRNPTSGSYYINVDEQWDGTGGNYLRFYGTFFSAGVLKYKIYG